MFAEAYSIQGNISCTTSIYKNTYIYYVNTGKTEYDGKIKNTWNKILNISSRIDRKSEDIASDLHFRNNA